MGDMIHGNTLKDADAARLLTEAEGEKFTLDDEEFLQKGLAGEMFEGDAPSIMGVQVHKVPFAVQLLYIVGVGAAVCFMVSKLVKSLVQDKDAEKAKKKAEKEAAK